MLVQICDNLTQLRLKVDDSAYSLFPKWFKIVVMVCSKLHHNINVTKLGTSYNMEPLHHTVG